MGAMSSIYEDISLDNNDFLCNLTAFNLINALLMPVMGSVKLLGAIHISAGAWREGLRLCIVMVSEKGGSGPKYQLTI